jgi:hypothetical protein
MARRAWTWRPCSTCGQCISSSVGCGDCVFCTSLATEQLDFLLKARMACIFNTIRYIDDINSPSSPKSCNFKEFLTDNRQFGGSDGVYPTHVIDDNGYTVANPMNIKLEKHGLTCTYLDFTIKMQHDGNLLTTVYQHAFLEKC